ncbi:hypothetical protein D3C84_1084980 [compost metagenome]
MLLNPSRRADDAASSPVLALFQRLIRSEPVPITGPAAVSSAELPNRFDWPKKKSPMIPMPPPWVKAAPHVAALSTGRGSRPFTASLAVIDRYPKAVVQTIS